MKNEYYLAILIACLIIAFIVVMIVKASKKKKRKKMVEKQRLVAAISCAISIYTDKPVSDFRVVSFKKTNKFKAWNSR